MRRTLALALTTAVIVAPAVCFAQSSGNPGQEDVAVGTLSPASGHPGEEDVAVGTLSPVSGHPGWPLWRGEA